MQPHLAGAEATHELLPLALGFDEADDLGVAQRPLRRPPVPGVVVGGRGDLDPVLLQHAAHRLDLELLLVDVDEVAQYLLGRPSSAAKEADADFKNSFVRRSSAFPSTP